MLMLLVMRRHSTMSDPCIQETASLVIYATYQLVNIKGGSPLFAVAVTRLM